MKTKVKIFIFIFLIIFLLASNILILRVFALGTDSSKNIPPGGVGRTFYSGNLP